MKTFRIEFTVVVQGEDEDAAVQEARLLISEHTLDPTEVEELED